MDEANRETFETWDRIAPLYQEKFMEMDFYNATYDRICATAKPNSKILELGCGPGNIAKYLLHKRPDFDLFGIDISENMIALAKVNNPHARFEVMDTREIGALTGKYDGMVGGFCLPYLTTSECNDLIENSSNLLNEDGLIYLSFVEGDAENSGYKEGSGGRVFFNYHNLEDLKNQLTLSNFEAIETHHVKYPTNETSFDIHTIVIAFKKVASPR